jgi:hypothetical protein
VLGLNLHRRHLTSSQRAVIGLSIEEYEAERAKERHAELAGRAPSNGGTISTVSDTGKARDKAAEAVGTNARYISDAKRIKADAPELLARRVERVHLRFQLRVHCSLGSVKRAAMQQRRWWVSEGGSRTPPG